MYVNSNDGGYSTTLTVTAIGGATSLTVGTGLGLNFANAQLVGVYLDDGTVFQTSVSGSPTSTTIPINPALPSQASSGKTIMGLRGDYYGVNALSASAERRPRT